MTVDRRRRPPALAPMITRQVAAAFDLRAVQVERRIDTSDRGVEQLDARRMSRRFDPAVVGRSALAPWATGQHTRVTEVRPLDGSDDAVSA